MSGKVFEISAVGTRGSAAGKKFTAVPDRSGRFVLNRKTSSSVGNKTNLAANKVYADTLDDAAQLLRTGDYLINLVGPGGSRALRELAKVKIQE